MQATLFTNGCSMVNFQSWKTEIEAFFGNYRSKSYRKTKKHCFDQNLFDLSPWSKGENTCISNLLIFAREKSKQGYRCIPFQTRASCNRAEVLYFNSTYLHDYFQHWNLRQEKLHWYLIFIVPLLEDSKAIIMASGFCVTMFFYFLHDIEKYVQQFHENLNS